MIKYNIPTIGQGCCVEQLIYQNLERHRILFDCGSDDINALKGYIDTLDTSISTTLVISHLHEDHINGIPYLFEHFKKSKQKEHRKNLKKIYLPYYCKEMYVLFALRIIAASTDETSAEDENLVNLIKDLERGEINSIEIIHVSPSENIEGRRTISHIKPQKITNSTNHVYWTIKFWVDADIYEILTTSDKEELQKINDVADYLNKAKDTRKIYDSIASKDKFNQTSMLMATYLSCALPTVICKTLPKLRYCCVADIFTNGFVCTGDYPFNKMKKMECIQKHYFYENIQIRQMMVPHHGGENDCKFIPFDFIQKAYAQTGMKNSHGHPSRVVIDFLEGLGIEFINKQNTFQA